MDHAHGGRTAGSSTLAAFAAAVVIGGANFLAVKLSNEELDPLFGAAVRFTAAAILSLAAARVLGLPLPRGRAAAGAALYGLLGFGFAYAFVYVALVGLTPGLTSVVMASVPIVTLAFAVAHRQERFTRRGIAGGLLAVAGIAALSSRALSGDVRPAHLLLALLGAAAVAESAVIARGFPRAHPFTTNAVGMAVGAMFLTVASLLFDERWAVPQSGRTWLVLLWLVGAGSMGLFALFLYVVARWEASATVYMLTLMPVVAVTLGVLFADEDLSAGLLVGAALVMSAVYVGALSRPAAPAAGEAAAVVPAPHAAGPGGAATDPTAGRRARGDD